MEKAINIQLYKQFFLPVHICGSHLVAIYTPALNEITKSLEYELLRSVCTHVFSERVWTETANKLYMAVKVNWFSEILANLFAQNNSGVYGQ